MKNREEILEYLLVQDEEDVTQFILDVEQGMNSWDFTINILVELLNRTMEDIGEIAKPANTLISEMERFIGAVK